MQLSLWVTTVASCRRKILEIELVFLFSVLVYKHSIRIRPRGFFRACYLLPIFYFSVHRCSRVQLFSSRPDFPLSSCFFFQQQFVLISAVMTTWSHPIGFFGMFPCSLWFLMNLLAHAPTPQESCRRSRYSIHYR